MSFLGRIGQDIIHPFGLGNHPQPIRTPAPMQQAPRPAISTPAPGIAQQAMRGVASGMHVAGLINPAFSAAGRAINDVGQITNHFHTSPQQIVNQGIQHLPQPVVRPAANFIAQSVVNPTIGSLQNYGKLNTGVNPYHGNTKQVLGQVGGDVVNLASVLPAGAAAKGVKGLATADKSLSLGARTLNAAKAGAIGSVKYGGAYGGLQGITSAMAQNQNAGDIATSGLRNAVIGAGASFVLGGTAGGIAPVTGDALRLAGKGIKQLGKGVQTATDVASSAGNTVKMIPDQLAHNQLMKTDPDYNGLSQHADILQRNFDRNTANGLSPKNPAQVQLQKSLDSVNTKTADMRNAMLENAKLTAQQKATRLLPGKGTKLNQSGSASGNSPLMPANKLIANAAEKVKARPAQPTPAAAAAESKISGSSAGSIAPAKETLEQSMARQKLAASKDIEAMAKKAKSPEELQAMSNGHHYSAMLDHATSETKAGLAKLKPGVDPNRDYYMNRVYKDYFNKVNGATADTAAATTPKPQLPGVAKSAGKAAGKPARAAGSDALGNGTPLNAESYANVFGGTKEEAAKELAATPKTTTRPVPKQKPAPATAAENTAKNPVKVDIPTVEAGNFEQARINPQLASHPVNFLTNQALEATKRLGLTTSEFGKMVEGTIKPGNAKEQAAVDTYRELTNRVHATSQVLGGNTGYVKNYFRHEWDLSNPEDAARFNKLAESAKATNPYAFQGLDNQPRIFKSIAQGEKLGFKLKNQNLADEIKDYGSGSSYALKQQALAKSLTEADQAAETKPHTFDLGGGKNVLLSDKGMHEAKGYAKSLPSDNPLLKGYRKGNRGFKQMLLSVSQFHPVNISVLRAGPTAALEGHPLRAAKGVFDTFAAQADAHYSTKLQMNAYKDGTIEASARMGTPIKFGSDFKTEGKIGFGKGGLGEKAIFERAMPAMHIQMVKGALADIEKRGLSLDSPEAHALGTRINEIMGFVNTEVRNLDPKVQRGLGDIFLAPQFTRAKWSSIAGAGKGGLAGSYARRAIIGNAAAAATVALGVGYALHQKSDNVNDILLRSVFHPSVPTPLKDSKGNTQELGLPATQSSEVLGLLGFSLKRGTNGHLSVDWKGGNIPTNAANYGRSRLGIIPGTGFKVATNTNYAGKPLYDPNASLKTKTAQAATTIGSGVLPIGAQGIVQTNAIKKHLPSDMQQVITANTPGSNPILKSVGSSFGLTPRTDKTVGKGQQTTQYFDALNSAGKGLNSQEKAVMTMVTGSKKNPVTGSYAINPSSDDSRAKATALLQNPKVITNLQQMNQKLASQGQKVDPIWTANKDQITKYYQYQAMPPGSADKADWMNKNKDWYQPIATARTDFFNSLPPGDPNRPKVAIQYPTATPAVQNLMDQYNNLTASADKSSFIKAHPDVVDQWDKQAAYTNALRTAQGYAALKTAPKATPQLQSFMDTYNAADKGTRKSIRNSNPQAYQNMIAYYDSVDLNTINKQGATNQLQGEPDQTSKQNKAIQGLAKDIYQASDGSYQIVPAGWMQGLSNGSSSSFGKFPKKPSAGRKVSFSGLKVGGSSKKLTAGMNKGNGKVKLLTYKSPTAVRIKKPKGAILA